MYNCTVRYCQSSVSAVGKALCNSLCIGNCTLGYYANESVNELTRVTIYSRAVT